VPVPRTGAVPAVARFAAPNLMIGNTIVLKHAPQCPESALAMEQLLRDAGLPEDAYINIFASNEQVAGMIADPRIAGVSVTGSERAGAAVASVAGQNLKKVVLELVQLGGHRINRPGAFVEPTVLSGVTPDMRAYREELFGPAAVVYQVADADEAVELANGSAFGLGGAVFSSDEKLAMEVADQLDVGMVWINTAELGGPELPFGGTKRSGVGRELWPLGIDEFVNKKLIHTPPAAQ
jgi:acyl-CoA reductase-like NAD-dependent aldehyde dehydrogenase